MSLTAFTRYMRWQCLIVRIALGVFTASIIIANIAWAATIFNAANDAGIRVKLDTWSVVNLVFAGLTKATLLVTIIVNMVRRGAFTSMVVFDICWLSVLCIFWVAAAGFTTQQYQTMYSASFSEALNIAFEESDSDDSGKIHTLQSSMQATLAFDWLNFIMLFSHIIMLLVLAILHSQQGNPIWKRSVRDALEKPVSLSLSTFATGKFDSDMTTRFVAPANVDFKVQAPATYPPQLNAQPVSYNSTEQLVPGRNAIQV